MKNKEKYRITIQQGLAMSYSLFEYNNLYECIKKLKELIKDEKENERKYYVLNNFYKNEYEYIEPIKKFSIEELINNKWVLFKKSEEAYPENKNKTDYNININLNIKIMK